MKRARPLTALACALALLGGCQCYPDDPYGFYDPPEHRSDHRHHHRDGLSSAEVITGVAIVGAVFTAYAIHSLVDASSDRAPERRLQTLRGAVVDADGKPLADTTIHFRPATKYMTHPEKVAPRIATTAADGSFSIPMAKTDYVCVDFFSPGAPPVRRWFIALAPKSVKQLPKDQSNITFVSPDQTVARTATISMAAQETQ